MSKNVKVTTVTPLNNHESEMGRGGLVKFTKITGDNTKEVFTIPTKTWDSELVSSDINVSDIKAELVTYRKLLEVETTFNKRTFKLNLTDELAVYVDWSTMIKQAMDLYGPNSYQEAKAKWGALSGSEKNLYSKNAETQLVALLKHDGVAELVLFTKN